jgi:DNA-directed RNA polymerase subunit RPC12/RpoP
MNKTSEIWKLWEQLKSNYGRPQAGELYNQLCYRLPRRLPQNAGVELPASGSAPVPAEKLREIFPNLSRLIDDGWQAFVTRDGDLVWWYPLNKCPVCGQEADLIDERIVLISNWNAVVTHVLRCPACGHKWLHEWQM